MIFRKLDVLVSFSVWMSPLILTALHYHQGLRAKSLSRVICQGIRYGPAHGLRTPDTLFSQKYANFSNGAFWPNKLSSI